MSHVNELDVDAHLSIAKEAALAGGALIRAAITTHKVVHIDVKSGVDLVTETDRSFDPFLLTYLELQKK